MSRWKLIWLGILFGYKAIIQIIGLILALKIRNVKVMINYTDIAAGVGYVTSLAC